MHMRQHAIVVAPPLARASDQAVARYTQRVERLVDDYVRSAQWMQTQAAALGDSATRLLLSVNVLNAVDKAKIARAVAIRPPQMAPPPLLADMQTRVRAWKTQDGRDVLTSQDAADALLRLLEAVGGSPSWHISVLGLADALLVPSESQRDAFVRALDRLAHVEFVLLRDEEECADEVDQQMLELTRVVREAPRAQCVIHQVADDAIELQGVLKQWLGAAAPRLSTTLVPSWTTDTQFRIRLELCANFLLPSSSPWQLLHHGMAELQMLHFVVVTEVHPSLLCGCPIRGLALEPGRMIQALTSKMRQESSGAVLRCNCETGHEFYLLTVDTAHPAEPPQFLLFRVASAEEVLLPYQEPCSTDAAAKARPFDEEELTSSLQAWNQAPEQAFNPFNYRSGILGSAYNPTASATASAVSRASSRRAAVLSKPAIAAKQKNALPIKHRRRS